MRSNGDYLRISLQSLAEKHGQGEVRGRGLLLALGLDGVEIDEAVGLLDAAFAAVRSRG